MKRRTQETISYRRALLIATIPSVGMWMQLRENPREGDHPFSRRPREFEVVELLVGAGIVVGGAIAGNTIVLILGGFLAASWSIRPLARPVISRKWVHSERELLALMMPTTAIHLVLLALPLYLAVRGDWLSAGIIGCGLSAMTLIGAFLLRLMFSGLVGRRGNHALS